MWRKDKSVKIPVEVSARHCHLSRADSEKLFGLGHELKSAKQLSQLSDFACQETVAIENNNHILENMRVIGPLREKTQVEISKTDAVFLGVNTPIRLSGDIAGSQGIILIGPVGRVDLTEGLIIAKRHLHCATEEAKRYKLKSGDIVSVRVEGERQIIFENIIVRVGDGYRICLHLDTDEGNAAGINKIGEGFLIK